ncbi:MAG: 50S ribosomal protein L23 [Candidatus Marinimicrobia bacterium]|jgi:large subunit ribosomal protein L23|nr:50S ribosomal protein L23 [Candidatus Neomarinimicrobiota bacterium]MBT3496663.1 50S ribosomal protein L23 [Candidatus Neomarinimicrobiota bacterium]MBT3692967.1 50S ribosomal protein L23 [Candidatus Neomarinimicrobiota bacterium]MBT3731964.1 50S ribosomal protein L23 [Candidatus Neomarinimicrobiota bacterium]MBT4144035.1 50S ribosomal protein L23 [Candidatus Neomarinimicrobiota bacterium]
MYQKIIIKPLFTEKMSALEEKENKWAFQVAQNANKNEIKKAVEKKFDVSVVKVATMNRQGKVKQMSVRSGGKVIRTEGARSSWKKAIVTLEKGSSIDLLSGEGA